MGNPVVATGDHVATLVDEARSTDTPSMDIVCRSCGSDDLTRDPDATGVSGDIPMLCLACGWRGTRTPKVSCPRCGSGDVEDTPVEGWAYEDLEELQEDASGGAWGYVEKTNYRCRKCRNEWQKAGEYRPYPAGDHVVGTAGSTAFTTIWARVKQHAGEEFLTKTGKSFSYDFTTGAVMLRNTNRAVPKSDFEEAFRRMPVSGPGELQDLQGPSYIYSLLTDSRICLPRV